MVYSVLKSLELEVKVLPVLEKTEFEDDDYYGSSSSKKKAKDDKITVTVGKDLWPESIINSEIEERGQFESVNT